MKKLLILISISIIALNSNSQNLKCGFDFSMYEQNNELLKNLEKDNVFAKKFTKTFNANEKGPVFQIPIVFHVIHNYGSENIPDSEILAELEVMNARWRKTDPDSTDIVHPFNLIHDDMEVEFVLATKDPSGNCTSGITRYASELTDQGGGDESGALIRSLTTWPPNEYLNVFICRAVGQGVGGYSQYPSGAAAGGIDGIMISRGQMSALAHEAGHYLNLPHLWGNSNNNSLQSNCNEDDGVDDTPNCIGSPGGCVTSRQTCDGDDHPFYAIDGTTIIWDEVDINNNPLEIIDNEQNVMDYAFCDESFNSGENFTQGQKARVHAALNSSTASRNNLHTSNNLLSTGADGSTCLPAPIIDFGLKHEYVCTGFANSLKNGSYNAENISYTWSAVSGVFSSTTADEPTITFNEPGFYDISLTGTSAGGSDSQTKEGLAKVLSGTPIAPFQESFTSENFPENSSTDPTLNWLIDPITQTSNTFIRSTEASSDGNSSLKLNIKNSAGTHRLFSPMIDMKNTDCFDLTFDVAYNKRSIGSNDKLLVKVSTSCGRTWDNSNIMLDLSADEMETGDVSVSGNFIPEADQWKSFKADFSKFEGRDILVMFEVITANGNTLYIDNINFDGCNTTSLVDPIGNEEYVNLDLFPNPSSGNVNLNISSSDIQNTIFVTDVTGKILCNETVISIDGRLKTTISELTGAKLEKGVYFVSVKGESNTITKKLIIK